jgi:hypothetical protein
MDTELIKEIAKYGVGGILAAALLWLLARVVFKIGERLIAAIDRLGVKWETTSERIVARLDEHTKADIGAIAMLVNRIDVLETKIDQHARVTEGLRDDVQEMLERTPVEHLRPTQSIAHGTPRASPRQASGIIDPAKGSQQIPLASDEPAPRAPTAYSFGRPATEGGRKKP